MLEVSESKWLAVVQYCSGVFQVFTTVLAQGSGSRLVVLEKRNVLLLPGLQLHCRCGIFVIESEQVQDAVDHVSRHLDFEITVELAVPITRCVQIDIHLTFDRVRTTQGKREDVGGMIMAEKRAMELRVLRPVTQDDRDFSVGPGLFTQQSIY